MLMLHIGCGDVLFEGWINIDIDSANADLQYDVRKPLPYNKESVDFIHHEHFIEHLSPDEAEVFLKEMYRILKPHAIMRIATPDLDSIAKSYFWGWRKQEWIIKYGYSHIQNRAEMMNIVFRHWGHQWIYNYDELKRRLSSAGFSATRRVRFRKSKYPQLCNRENREDSKLIVEVSR